MNRYRIWESVLDHTEQVHSYEDLEIHHPRRNQKGLRTGRPEDFEPRRQHERIEGEFEEVRPLPDGRRLVKKDFVLQHDATSPVYVPAPVAGHVHYLHDQTAAVRIYDRPFGEAGAKLLAQSLHMDPQTFRLREGERIEYGEPMGVMADRGTPGVIHAHVEAEPEQFRRYIRDIQTGLIGPRTYPKASHAEPTDRVVSLGGGGPHNPADRNLHDGSHGEQVRSLQDTLATLGYRNPDGTPLVADGRFGSHTRAAVEAFQREHGLRADGVVGERTQRILAATQANPLADRSHPQHGLYVQALRQVHAEETHRQLPHGRHSEHLAGALAVAAGNAGVARIDRIEINPAGTQARAVQVSALRDEPGLNRTTPPVDIHRALGTPLHAHEARSAMEPGPSTRQHNPEVLRPESDATHGRTISR